MQRLRSVFTTDIVTGELTASKMLQRWETWVEGKATRNTTVTDTIEINGRRKKGKPKLTQDEASKLLAWCLAHPHDEGAIATAMAFLLGMRASEIVTCTVRHLDGKGTLLDITDAKTEAGERTLKLPQALQPLLASLAAGKKPDDRLFGENTRHWSSAACEGAARLPAFAS